LLPQHQNLRLNRTNVAFGVSLGSIGESPELAALYDKWFTQPIPPKGVNLDIPMSPAMKRAFEKPTDSPDPSTY
jgi:glutamate/aspartate transport system substrate-binding protein